MRIALASTVPPGDIGGFSGIPYYMSRAIRAAVESFKYIHSPDPRFDPSDIAKGKGIKEARDELEEIGRVFSKRLRELKVDAVICVGHSMIPYCETDALVVLWQDAIVFSFTQMDFEEFKARRVVGTPEECMQKIRRYVDEAGVTYFQLAFLDLPKRESMKLFAEEVMPAFNK